MNRPRAADDFATIRARMEELRREREAVRATEGELQSDGGCAPTEMRTSHSKRSARGQDGSDNLARYAARSRGIVASMEASRASIRRGGAFRRRDTVYKPPASPVTQSASAAS
jgi:hypothetical protein